jgi:hypothetical protein
MIEENNPTYCRALKGAPPDRLWPSFQEVTNNLAYYSTVYFTTVGSFVAQAHGNFTLVYYL